MVSLISLLKEAVSTPKAIILAGAPGAGKGSVLRGLDLSGLKTFNLDNKFIELLKAANVSLDLKSGDAESRSKAAQAMAAATKNLKTELIPQAIENKQSFVLDGTAASSKQTLELKNQLEEAGYEVMMLYVYTDLETSLKRNQERFEKSGGEDRSLMPSIVLTTWNSVTKNFDIYKNEFENFVSVANTGKSETLKDVKKILDKYVKPFRPTDTKPKTEKEKERSRKQAEKLNQEVQQFLSSDKVKDIIDSSVSSEEAQSKINAFLK